jgi:alpha-N-arabinofuranosidase
MPIQRRLLLATIAALTTGACLGLRHPVTAPTEAALQATVTIDATRVANRLSPQLYGHFIEYMFEGIKFGLHAEMLRNRSFEEPASSIGLPRYWEREPNDRNDDRETRFYWDSTVGYAAQPPVPAYDSARSLKITINAPYDGPRGVRQERIPVRASTTYNGSFWMKTPDYDGAVALTLGEDREGGRSYGTAVIREINKDDGWHQYVFTLRSPDTDPLAKFTMLFDGRGKLWLDQISLMPGDAVHGVRADVFERAKALRPAFIRWPGGNVAQDYHWEWGIGPRDLRPPWVNRAWWEELEPSDFGTDEFLTFCRELGAEPHVVVNVEGAGATAEEAAAWVQYMNGPATSKYGALRAKHGHPEPYNVKTWELGNEIWGDWVRGASDAATYAHNYLRYRDAMRAVDPSIRFIAVGRDRTNWNDEVLRIAGRGIDLLSLHHYDPPAEEPDLLDLLARPVYWESYYQELGTLIRERVPGSDIRLIVNEWNSVLPLPRQHSMEAALYAGRMLNVFERSGELVVMSAVSDLVNGWPGGIIQAGRHGVYVTPTYHVIRLYNQFLGAERIEASVQSPTFDPPHGAKEVPFLDVTASRSSDGQRYYVKAVNTNLNQPVRASISVDGWRPPRRATIHTLTGPTLKSANSFATPDLVAVTTKSFSAGPQFAVDLPRHSVSVIVLGRQ